jgi:hypothetical protein
MDNNMNSGTDIWSPLGEQRWRELAEGSSASKLQLKFAAARFGGMNATAAAKAAGYSGDKDSLRRAGYSALRSTAVQALLELAALNAPLDAKITEKEIDAKLARLIRSGDPLTMLKATELHQKREAARAAELATKREEDDFYLNLDQMDADLICAMPSAGIGGAILLGMRYSDGGNISNFHYLKEIAPLVSRKFPENCQRWRSRLEHPGFKNELAYVDQCAAGPLLEAEALIAAVRAKSPRANAPKIRTGRDFVEANNAAR